MIALAVVIALTTGALSWNRARIAAAPEPRGERMVTRSYADWADIYEPAGRDRLPTLLFSPGLGVSPAAYGTFLTDIASHGFLVVAVPYPPVKIDDNADFIPALPKISGSLSLALDRLLTSDSLRSRIDTMRIAAIGHSFGGGAAALTCIDPRLRAAVDFDGSLYGRVVHEGVRCPFLLIQQSLSRIDTVDAPVFYEERSQGRLHEDSIRAHTAHMEWVTVDGLDHMSFTDAGLTFTTSNWLNEATGRRLNAVAAQRATADSAMRFLERQLRIPRRTP